MLVAITNLLGCEMLYVVTMSVDGGLTPDMGSVGSNCSTLKCRPEVVMYNAIATIAVFSCDNGFTITVRGKMASNMVIVIQYC